MIFFFFVVVVSIHSPPTKKKKAMEKKVLSLNMYLSGNKALKLLTTMSICKCSKAFYIP